MHILLALLGTVVTILILLNRLAEAGIDLGGLNPFLWQRRRKWKKLYEGNPVFKLSDPMDVTGLLMVAVAKCDGDMSSEQKGHILELFEQDFHLSRRDAQDLLISAVHLHGDGREVREKIGEVLKPALETFSAAQANSAIDLVKRVAARENRSSADRNDLVAAIERELSPRMTPERKWA